jgi:hypothetical protein
VATGLRVSAILLQVNIAPSRYGTGPSPPSDGRFTPKVDIAGRRLNVRFVPQADITILFDSLASGSCIIPVEEV